MHARSPMSGRVWRTPATAVEDVLVPAGVHLRRHGHDVPHLCFLLDGCFSERHGDRIRVIEPGVLRSSPAGDEHDIIFQTDTRCLLVLIHGNPVAVAPPVAHERRFFETERLKMLGRRLAASLDPAASPLEVEAVVLELLAAAMSEVTAHRAAPPPPWLGHIRDRLRSVPFDPPSTSDLAAEAGYHPIYVARAFRRYYGLGIDEYARLARVEYARTLITETDMPLAQLALRAGYSDQSHLTRSMRRHLHTTPSVVRRKLGRIIQVSSIQESGDAGS